MTQLNVRPNDASYIRLPLKYRWTCLRVIPWYQSYQGLIDARFRRCFSQSVTNKRNYDRHERIRDGCNSVFRPPTRHRDEATKAEGL